MESMNFSLQECDAVSLDDTSLQTLKDEDIFIRNNATNHHIPEDRKLQYIHNGSASGLHHCSAKCCHLILVVRKA
jgi:hypothetical protein